MRIQVRSPSGKAAFRAVIGTFEPITKYQLELFRRLSVQSHKDLLQPAVIIIDPAPASFIKRETGWPVIHDLAARRHHIEQSGIDCVCVCTMAPHEAASGAKWFLSAVCRKLEIKSLWLGAGQSLGPGPKGSDRAINAACEKLGIEIERMRMIQPKNVAGLSRQLFAEGRAAAAWKLLRLPATITNEADLEDWPSGPYLVAPGIGSIRKGLPGQARAVSIRLSPRPPRLAQWPFPGESFLSVLAGPAELLDGTAH